MPSATISVILINRNGGEYLRRALVGLRGAVTEAVVQSGLVPSGAVEIVFVDNGSTDQSREIAQEVLADLVCEWQLVEEPEPGVNSARIAGLEAARGDLLIFTDNDLEFEPGWLVAYHAAFQAHPECRVFAGRVLVGQVEGHVPDWLDLRGEYSRTSIVVRCDNGESERTAILSDSSMEGPVGPNMAMHRSVFDDYGPFNTDFGLRPGSLVPGAEAEFFHRLAKHGEQFVYVPGACVHHPLKRNQISKAYFRRRMHGVGRVTARIQALDGKETARLFGVRRYRYRQLAEAWLAYVASFLGGGPQRRFYRRCEISKIWGQMVEDRAQEHRTVGDSSDSASTKPMVVNAR
jgi:glycosyltransferase involved in cell wall biosynthesis